MLKQSGVLNAKAAALVAVFALVSTNGFAELNPVTSAVIRSATAGLNGERKASDPNEGAREQLESQLERIQDVVTKSTEERTKRDRNAKGAKEKAKAIKDTLTLQKAEADIKQVSADNNKAALARVQQLPSGKIGDASMADTSKYTGECKVPMDNAKSVLDLGATKEFSFIKQQLGKKFEDRAKTDTEEALKAIKALKKRAKQAREDKKKEDAGAAQQNVAQFAAPDKNLLGTPEIALAGRIARLESDWRTQKPLIEEAKEEKEEAVDKFLDFTAKALQGKINIQEDLIPLADALETKRKQIYKDAYDGAKAAFAACKAKSDAMLVGANGQKAEVTTARNWVKAVYAGPANAKKASEFNTEIAGLEQNVQCVDKAPSIKSALGPNLAQQIEQLKYLSDEKVVAPFVVQVTDAFNTAVANTSTMLHGKSQNGQVTQLGVLSACEIVQAKEKRVRDISLATQKVGEQARENVPFGARRPGAGRRGGPGFQGAPGQFQTHEG